VETKQLHLTDASATVDDRVQWWKQDQNVKTKTKTKTVRPKPKMHNRKKSLLLQHARLLSKNNLVQKTSKSDDQ